MKKILIAVVVALVAMASANAQVAPGMKYKDLKGMYDTKEYVQQAIDPYRVGWTKFFSFFTPGLGHIMMGEVGRGFIFVGAEAVCTSIIRDSWDGLKPYLVYDGNGTVTGFSDRDAAGKHITGFSLVWPVRWQPASGPASMQERLPRLRTCIIRICTEPVHP